MSEQRRPILVPVAWAACALAVPCSAVPFAAVAAADSHPRATSQGAESATPSPTMCAESACSAPADRNKDAEGEASQTEEADKKPSAEQPGDSTAVSARDAYEDADIEPGDQLLVGDWNKDGRSAFGVRRAGRLLLANPGEQVGSFANYAFGGDTGQAVVGHWGTTRDTVAVHDGNAVNLRRWFTTGTTDRTFTYGEAGDELVSGDWDGDGYGGPAVRRGNTFYVRNNATTGIAEFTFSFGEAGGQVLVGDFNGDGKDTVAVRNGATVQVLNTLANFNDTDTVELSSANARVVSGDFDGDGKDTIEAVADAGAEADAAAGDSSAHNTPAPSDTNTGDGDDASGDSAQEQGQEGSEGNETHSDEATSEPTDDKEPAQDAATGTGEPDATGTDAALGRLPRPEPDEDNDPSPQQVVGKDLDSGVYKVATTEDECFLSVVYSDGKTQSGRVQGGPQAQVYLTLNEGDALAVTGCTVSNVADQKPAQDAVPGDGEWLVGTDVAAGKFEVGGGENCFATVLASTERDAEIVYSLVGETTTVEVADGQLISSDACTWSALP